MLRRHVANTDVAVEVLKRFYVRETRTMKLKVRWWNIGRCHAPWCMAITQRLAVPVDVWLRDWRPYPLDTAAGAVPG